MAVRPSAPLPSPTSPTTDALAYMQQRLRRMGVERALAKAGARDGDVVRIGGGRAHLRRGGVTSSPVAVVKIGTSSITLPSGELDDSRAREAGRRPRGRARDRPARRARACRARSRPGCRRWAREPSDRHRDAAGHRGRRPAAPARADATRCSASTTSWSGQVLLTPYDFFHRSQYLHAKVTLQQLLDLGVLPIINENDAVADDEIRYGDNDRLAALVVAHARRRRAARCSPTPRACSPPIRAGNDDASLIEEIVEIDAALERVAGGAGTERGSGGMASKLAAAKIAAWSGVRAVIASAGAPDVVADALAGRPVGTSFAPRAAPAAPEALDRVRAGIGGQGRGRRRRAPGAARAAARRCCRRGSVTSRATSRSDAAVEIVDEAGEVFAKGLCRYNVAAACGGSAGAGPRISPTGSPTRSSTAMTWSFSLVRPPKLPDLTERSRATLAR